MATPKKPHPLSEVGPCEIGNRVAARINKMKSAPAKKAAGKLASGDLTGAMIQSAVRSAKDQIKAKAKKATLEAIAPEPIAPEPTTPEVSTPEGAPEHTTPEPTLMVLDQREQRVLLTIPMHAPSWAEPFVPGIPGNAVAAIMAALITRGLVAHDASPEAGGTVALTDDGRDAWHACEAGTMPTSQAKPRAERAPRDPGQEKPARVNFTPITSFDGAAFVAHAQDHDQVVEGLVDGVRKAVDRHNATGGRAIHLAYDKEAWRTANTKPKVTPGAFVIGVRSGRAFIAVGGQDVAVIKLL